MKILVNCYACSPFQGSEPGMGWNFISNLSRIHELYIITESKFKADLDRYFEIHPKEKKYYKFYFIEKERHKTLRKFWPPSYYWFYKDWQKKALVLAKELDVKENFDIVHQLNMIGYREPGFFYHLNKPLVWGPIGGFNITPWNFMWTMGVRGFIFYSMRNTINLFQMRFNRRVTKAIDKANALLCATSDDAKYIKKIWGKDSILIPEVGLHKYQDIKPIKREGRLKICWSGILADRKSLNLLLESLALCPNRDNVELHIIGDGDNRKKWEKQVLRLALKNVIWYGWVKREEAIEIMQQCHLFTITSLSDATSTVLLEALSYGLPVIAPNHCGFANVVTNDCGIKIDLNNKSQFLSEYANAIELIYNDDTLRESLSKGASCRAQEFAWDKKIDILDSIYKKIKNEIL